MFPTACFPGLGNYPEWENHSSSESGSGWIANSDWAGNKIPKMMSLLEPTEKYDDAEYASLSFESQEVESSARNLVRDNDGKSERLDAFSTKQKKEKKSRTNQCFCASCCCTCLNWNHKKLCIYLHLRLQ